MPRPRAVPAAQRFRLDTKDYSMAFDTKQVQPGFRLCMTPSMSLVQKGKEFDLPDGSKLWNRNSRPWTAYRMLLNHIADNALVGSAKKGYHSDELAKLGQGHVWFMHPQVLGNDRNIHDETCHMPARQGFKHAVEPCPYTVDHSCTKNTWYTWVNLGKDKHGKVVKERVHAILAAARWGIPETVFDITLRDDETDQALHTAVCPGHSGGCCNPLHVTWGLNIINRQQQENKRTNMNRGPRAHGPHRRFRLATD